MVATQADWLGFLRSPTWRKEKTDSRKLSSASTPVPWQVQHAHACGGILRDSEEDWDPAGNPDSPSRFGIHFVSYSTSSQ